MIIGLIFRQNYSANNIKIIAMIAIIDMVTNSVISEIIVLLELMKLKNNSLDYFIKIPFGFGICI